jgi:hypothetical protein
MRWKKYGKVRRVNSVNLFLCLVTLFLQRFKFINSSRRKERDMGIKKVFFVNGYVAMLKYFQAAM